MPAARRPGRVDRRGLHRRASILRSSSPAWRSSSSSSFQSGHRHTGSPHAQRHHRCRSGKWLIGPMSRPSMVLLSRGIRATARPRPRSALAQSDRGRCPAGADRRRLAAGAAGTQKEAPYSAAPFTETLRPAALRLRREVPVAVRVRRDPPGPSPPSEGPRLGPELGARPAPPRRQVPCARPGKVGRGAMYRSAAAGCDLLTPKRDLKTDRRARLRPGCGPPRPHPGT